MRVPTYFLSVFIILILLVNCSNQKHNKNYEDEFRKLQKQFDLEFSDEESFLILIPITGCSSCIQPVLEFIQRNRNFKNVTCIISDIGTKRIDSYLKDTIKTGLRLIPDYNAELYGIDFYLDSPVVYNIKKGRCIGGVILNSQNAQEILSEMK